MFKPTTVELKIKHGVATLTLHSEKQMNLLSSPTSEQVLRIGSELMRNEKLRLVILTGAGERAFIAGKDINELAGYRDGVMALNSITKTHMVCHLFRALPVPSIARVNGYCLGAGMEVAAACDIRVGADHSRYGMPEVQVGTVSVVEAALLPSLIGWGKTRELLYRGTMMDADEAYRSGFLQAKAPLARLDEAMAPIVEDILAAEPNAIRAQKKLIESWLDDTGVAAGVQKGIDYYHDVYLQGNAVGWAEKRLKELQAQKAGKPASGRAKSGK
ncbi:MAG: enoyl-CoA hydratase/isomerase family protein [Candidatus Lambdaproteobacteria bacterium]|nr:enoyl-CoA hydratase/isomerase family protein [Candidatus Lambdaproteobacteria bacterium]